MNRFYYILILCIVGYNISVFSQNAINQLDDKGKKTGYWINYSKDGKSKLEEGNYKDDKKDGIWKGFFPNGKIKHEITYTNGLAKGYAKMFYEDGKPREEGTWNETCWIGDYRYYFPNGQVAYVWNYNNQGKREGEQKYFYENGNLKYKGGWENGKVKTNVEVYDESGKFVQNRIYENGKFAESVTTPQNIDNQSNKSYSTFTGTGYHTVYRLDMQVAEKGYFENGKLIKGEKFEYDENGALIVTKVYEKGQLVKVNPVNK